jgi:hypothetical protein
VTDISGSLDEAVWGTVPVFTARAADPRHARRRTARDRRPR